MTTHLVSAHSPVLNLRDRLEYPEAGVLSKVVFQDSACQYTLFCLAEGTEISEHTATRNATVHVLEGTGTLILNGDVISLDPGTFVFMAANAPHALQASSNLSFLLTLSATS
ncbi:cupin domain-containing protein [Baaleninema simplex]|uniref:cupin domain-containing protein n=1 Tax=Baaleninema simplex TaxID=2862350 RepID=UPI000345EDFA|nr:cupin domain-containing protein [Baaleninema simplex]